MPTFAELRSARSITYLSGLWERWRSRSDLDAMDPCELERIASDLGMRGPELKELAAHGQHAADQLHERMRLLGLTRADVERLARGLMWDLERVCTRCGEKGACNRDLATRPQDPSWGGYCPNAAALTAVKIAHRQSSAP